MLRQLAVVAYNLHFMNLVILTKSNFLIPIEVSVKDTVAEFSLRTNLTKRNTMKITNRFLLLLIFSVKRSQTPASQNITFKDFPKVASDLQKWKTHQQYRKERSFFENVIALTEVLYMEFENPNS